MKFGYGCKFHHTAGRTPQGVRGLKYHIAKLFDRHAKVAPRKGCVD